MGLDQYLVARRYVSAHIFGEPEGGAAAQDKADAELATQFSGSGMVAQAILPPSSMKPNPEWDKVAEVLGDKRAATLLDDHGYTIEQDIVQWRKFNALHGWMENHLSASGTLPNNENVYLPDGVLAELISDLESIAETIEVKGEGDDRELVKIDHALVKRVMPPTQGFFFGPSEVDVWYAADVLDALHDITSALAREELSGAEWHYRGWW